MKRKLSAIIALVLAVVMVFPTAIFVGAATTPMTVEVTGDLIDATGKLVEGKTESGETISITMAVGAKASFTIKNQPDGTELKYNTNGKTAIGYDVADNSITAEKAGSATLTITAEKAGAVKATVTVAVTVIPKAITKVVLSGEGAYLDPNKTAVLDGYEQYNAGDTLSITDIYVEYNNAEKENVSPTKDNLKLVTYNKGTGETTDHTSPSVALVGDDTELRFKYIDSANLYKEGVISLNVTTSGIDEVWVEQIDKTDVNPDNKDKLTTTDLLNRIRVGVDYTELNVDVYYYTQHEGTDFVITFYEDSAYNTVCDFDLDAYFTVTVKDKVWPAKTDSHRVRVKDYFTFYSPTPIGVDIDWTNAFNKNYYEGYIIGSDVSDWQGVVVTVTYENDNGEQTREVYTDANVIYNLDIVLSPINVRQKFVTIETIGEYVIGKASNLPTGFTLLYREVMSMTIDAGTRQYAEGDKLDLTGIKATLKYNYGDPVTGKSITNDEFTCSPKNGTKLTADIDEVLVVYKDPNTGKEVSTAFPITVTASVGAIKDVVLVNDGAKTDYFIGESLEKDGYRLFVIYKDDTPSRYVYLNECTAVNVNNTSVYKNNAFQTAFSSSLTVSYKLPASIDAAGTVREITLNNITVTKRPLLVSIVADSDKTEYMEGESPRVSDFTITAKYDDGNQRIFKADPNVSGTAKTSYSVAENGVTYTVKLTPTMIDADTDAIRVSYTEKVTVGTSTTTTKYDDVDIKVTIPDAILTYYSTTDKTYITEAFEDIYDALERAEEVYGSYTSTYASRIPQIELRRDVTMVSDYTVTEPMEIDLNGFTLTMIRGEIYVSSRASSATEVTFTNSVKTDAKLVYSNNEDDTVIIAFNDEYVIDRETTDAGKYDVVISTVKNGKVTGPDEVTHGHDAQFTITPNEGYAISTIKVNNKAVTIPNDGKLIIENVQEKLTVTVTFVEKAWDNPFTDVYKSATYYKSVEFVYENGLFNGMSATKFEPDTTMTRAMFVTVLGRLAGIDADAAEARYGYASEFTDVTTDNGRITYAIPYIKWASDNGLIEGYGNGKFGPEDNITHAQMYVLMERYASYIERLNTNAAGTNIAVNDKKDIPDWAYEAVEYAAKKSFMITSSNRLTPNANAKRSELAMLLDKFCTNVLDY